MNPLEAFAQFGNPEHARFLRMVDMQTDFVRAEGCCCYDRDGNEYLDLISGFGAINFGHNHPLICDAVKDGLDTKVNQLFPLGYNPEAGVVAARLSSLLGAGDWISFFGNSGSEAVEGALKTARAATGRPGVIFCAGAYHGTTLGALSLMAAGPWRDAYEPLLPGFTSIPFNDLNALESAITSKTAAFVVEPVQAEGGVRLPASGYLSEASRICRENDVLMVVDEVQTGIGRTGSIFAFQQYDFCPDIVVSAKSLGGGIMPISAYSMRREIYDAAYGDIERCAVHDSTFAANTLSCRAALAALELVAASGFTDDVAAKGRDLQRMLNDAIGNSPAVAEIRGLGLLIGIEFTRLTHPAVQWENMGVLEYAGLNPAASLAMRSLFRNRIITHICGHDWSTLKVEPPLTITTQKMARFVEAISDAVTKLEEWV